VTTRLRLAALGALTGVAVCGAIVLAAFDPAASAIFPPCPFHALTGLHCPGCGAARAGHALLSGDLAGAVGHNVLLVVAAPWLALGVVRETLRVTGARVSSSAPRSAWWIRAALAVLVTFTVLRNLPAFVFLAPG
jgi:hypothetical protein